MRASGFLLVPYESELSTAYSQMRTPYIRMANIRAIPQHEVKKTGVPKYSCFFGDPWENRTPVSALRGPCLSRLTNGPFLSSVDSITHIF